MIEVVNVHKSYRSGSRSVEALRGVSCRIDRGRFAFIVGPSGSGKSTLLYLMGAIDRPTSGEIIVDGQDLVTMSEAAQNIYRRDQIGFIFQSFNLISNLTALENVLVPFLPRGVTPELRQRGVDLLTEVGLGDRLDHRPYQLSGGEQQRVAIARALVKQPILVLADEPTGELDSKTGDEIYTILRRLQESSQTTLVVVTHDRRFITPDDLVLEIQDGQLASRNGSATREISSGLDSSIELAQRSARSELACAAQSRRMTLPKTGSTPVCAWAAANSSNAKTESTTGRTSPRSSHGTDLAGEPQCRRDLLLQRPCAQGRADDRDPLAQHEAQVERSARTGQQAHRAPAVPRARARPDCPPAPTRPAGRSRR